MIGVWGVVLGVWLMFAEVALAACEGGWVLSAALVLFQATLVCNCWVECVAG